MKRSREPIQVQLLREQVGEARDHGLTLVDWVTAKAAVAKQFEWMTSDLAPRAQEYVRRTIFGSESVRLDEDRKALNASLEAEAQAASSAESAHVQVVKDQHAAAAQRLAELKLQMVAARVRLAELEIDEVRLRHLVDATRRRCEIVEADNDAANKGVRGQ